MKIAIANPCNFSDAEVWIKYAKDNNIDCIEVDPYDSNIIEQVKDCDIFIWHHSQDSYKDLLLAKPLLFSLQCAGKVVYPDFNSGWHFDDKLGQKYLFEASGAPFVKSYAFYTKEEAINWAKKTAFPKVFKLRGGAGSKNVSLVNNYNEAVKLIRKAFRNGFEYHDSMACFKETLSKYRRHKATLNNVFVSFFGLFHNNPLYRLYDSQKGYIYFQDYMEGNSYDTRVVVVGGRYAVAERRMVRKNDFRASGSGDFSYEGIDENIVRMAMNVSKRLKLQSAAFDFVYDKEHNPLIVEVCFGFGRKGISHAPYYWDENMVMHKNEKFDTSIWIIESLIDQYHNN